MPLLLTACQRCCSFGAYSTMTVSGADAASLAVPRPHGSTLPSDGRRGRNASKVVRMLARRSRKPLRSDGTCAAT